MKVKEAKTPTLSHPAMTTIVTNNTCSNATATTSSQLVVASNYTQPLVAASIGQLANPPYPCPFGTVLGTYNSTVAFRVYCNSSYGADDITGFIAYSINDCLDACIAYNENDSRQGNATCLSFSYALSLGFWATHGIHANCYLKRGPLPSPTTMQVSGSFGPIWTGIMCQDRSCTELYD